MGIASRDARQSGFERGEALDLISPLPRRSPFPGANKPVRRNPHALPAAAGATAADVAAPAPATASAATLTQGDPVARAFDDLERIEAFLQWLGGSLLASLYPSAPFERKLLALDVLLQLLEAWGPAAWPPRDSKLLTEAASGVGVIDESLPALTGCEGEERARRARLLRGFAPLAAPLLAPGATAALVGGLVESWDRLRAGEARGSRFWRGLRGVWDGL